MYERFSDRARKVMQYANQEAQRFNYEFISPPLIMIGILEQVGGIAHDILLSVNTVPLVSFTKKIRDRLPPGPDLITIGRLPLTPSARKVVEQAGIESRNIGELYIGTEHLLLALLKSDDPILVSVFQELSLTFENISQRILGSRL